jgi:hypothetical protein
VVFTAGFRVVGATAKSDTGIRGAGATVSVTCSRAGATVVIGHTASKSWEVNASDSSGEGKSTARSVSSPLGSVQIRGTVSVHQGSLIRKACRYVRRACMWVVCCRNCTWVWSSTVRTTPLHRAQQFATVNVIASGLRACRSCKSVRRCARRGMQAPVQGACSRERAGAEKRARHCACQS